MRNRTLSDLNLNIVHPVLPVQQGQSHLTDHNQHDRITYTGTELRSIGNAFLLNTKHRSVPNYQALRKIKELHINKRWIRLQKWTKHDLRRANLNNLSDIPLDASTPVLNSKNIRVGTVNVRSLKTSVNLVQSLLLREHLDVLLITETWLRASDEEWMKAQGFNSIHYKFSSYPRPSGRRGGGIMLLFKKTIKLLTTKRVDVPFAEAAMWKLESKKSVFNILGVYHPPSSSKNQVPDTLFSDNLADCLANLIPDTNNLIVSGDFNIHVNDVASDDAYYFLDALSSLGLQQHVSSATHVHGNTLDLVFTDPDVLPISKCACVWISYQTTELWYARQIYKTLILHLREWPLGKYRKINSVSSNMI